MRSGRLRNAGIVVALALTLGAAAACGNITTPAPSSSTPAAGASAPGSGAASGPAAAASTTVKAASTALGTILVNAQGMTLYRYTADANDKSNCTWAGCTALWPPVPAPAQGAPTAGPGVTGTLGVIVGPTGQNQVTYGGWPLYTYAADTKPGQTNGQKFKDQAGTWYVVYADPSKNPAPAGAPASASGAAGSVSSSASGAATPAASSASSATTTPVSASASAPSGTTPSSSAAAPVATPSGSASAPASSSSAAARPATVEAVTTSLGTVLANASGMTLYRYSADTQGKSNCTWAGCTHLWPPLLAPAQGTPTAGAGVTGTLGVIVGPTGQKQVTYGGWPLYTFAGDAKPGDTTGDNVTDQAGTWHVVFADPSKNPAPPA